MEGRASNLGGGSPSPRLKLSKRFYLMPLNEERVVARTGGISFNLRGKGVARLLAWLAPKLDGRSTFEELVAQSGEFTREEVAGALVSLLQHSIIEDADLALASSLSEQEQARYEEQRIFFSHFSQTPGALQAALKQAHVVVIGMGAVGSEAALCLARSGVGRITAWDDARVDETLVNRGTFYNRSDAGKLRSEVAAARLKEANSFTQADGGRQPMTSAADVEGAVREANLALLCLDDPATEIWDWMNEACLKRNVAWTSAQVEDLAGRVGPSVVPFQTPCYKCYDLRRKSNLDFEDFEEAVAWEGVLRGRGGRVDFTTGTIPAFAPLLGAAAAVEALKLLTGFEKPTALGAVWEIDFPTLRTVVRPLLKLPRCPACSRKVHVAPD